MLAPSASRAEHPLSCPAPYDQWYGGLYSALLTGITVAKLGGKKVPGAAGIPVVVGGFMLCNMADLAYGNKLQRVIKEAEHIMAEERPRLVSRHSNAFEPAPKLPGLYFRPTCTVMRVLSSVDKVLNLHCTPTSWFLAGTSPTGPAKADSVCPPLHRARKSRRC